ncbi:ATPase [Rhizobium wenxiniae]|uniref:Putative ATPase n=1 Tax=Rhizobium wenxiniae TaxID=1737357 RepID=A0A7X0D0N6_9HYPH|nr:winged helix-turn-helix domain-containing protein [Rhizobium wenxiniae]MBB6163630.1 putative ATPase [Rhizobium wenxiniae]GGG11812.1 ATPase [Rhizobium wenxiniae]
MSLLQFDDYEIDIEQRRLTERGQPLRLGGRAFDILSTLVSRAGEVISKEELINLVWPTTTVDEGSLRVHLVSLRKTLGDGAKHYIETIPGRGYVFAGNVQSLARNEGGQEPDTAVVTDLMSALPRIPRKLVGRDEFIASTLELLKTARLLTIAGPGGIGKTSVAVVCAHALSASRRIVFVDLAVVADGEKLLPSIASQLGLNTFGEDILPGILTELSKTQTLLLFDNCERIVDAAANVAEALLRSSPTTQVLATSREALRASMERVRQLSPLEYPMDGRAAPDPGEYPGVELFISLAALAGDNIDLTEPDSIQLAADIVRRLDGIPLAIELAAARSFDMDLATLHRSVADPIAVLRRGRRTAPPRQHTLRATIDWSYSTLSGNERELLQRLSVFAGTFSPEAAMAVAGSEGYAEEFHEAFDGLFLKSLLVVTQHGGKFRLLGATRDYAREKLAQAEFATSCRHSHAVYCLDRTRVAERDWSTADPAKWRSLNTDLVHDLRAALLWAFSDGGDEDLGIQLTAASDTIWVQFGLIAEQLAVAERALRLFVERGLVDTALEMRLRMSYGSALYHTKSIERNADVIAEYHRVLDLAVAEKNTVKLMRAIVGIAAIQTSNGDYQGAIDLVNRFDGELDTIAPQARSRLLNHNYHYVGDFNKAMEHAWIALSTQCKSIGSQPNSGSSFDPRISTLCTVVKTHWIQGRYSAARAALKDTLEETVARDHAISTCLFLAASACPTAFGLSDTALAAELLGILREVSAKNSLLRWRDWASGYESVLAALHTQDRGSFQRSMNGIKGAPFENSIVMAGRLADDTTLQRIDPVGTWCGSEALRLRGELAMQHSPTQGRALLVAAYDLAVSQAGTTFELRCATSILRHSPPDRLESARSRLLKVMDSVEYDERVEDVTSAKALL